MLCFFVFCFAIVVLFGVSARPVALLILFFLLQHFDV